MLSFSEFPVPDQVSIYRNGTNGMTVLFLSNACPKTDYTVEFTSINLETLEFDIINQTNFVPATFYGLNPGEMYRATARAKSPYGEGGKSLFSNWEQTGELLCIGKNFVVTIYFILSHLFYFILSHNLFYIKSQSTKL